MTWGSTNIESDKRISAIYKLFSAVSTNTANISVAFKICHYILPDYLNINPPSAATKFSFLSYSWQMKY